MNDKRFYGGHSAVFMQNHSCTPKIMNSSTCTVRRCNAEIFQPMAADPADGFIGWSLEYQVFYHILFKQQPLTHFHL